MSRHWSEFVCRAISISCSTVRQRCSTRFRQVQYAGRVFTLQLYNESSLRGKRIDQLIATYNKFTTPSSNEVQFQFTTPQVTVRHTQIWLLAMYGSQLPPGSTPTPSPTPAPQRHPRPAPHPSPPLSS